MLRRFEKRLTSKAGATLRRNERRPMNETLTIINEAPEDPRYRKLCDKIISASGGEPEGVSFTTLVRRNLLPGATFKQDLYEVVDLPTYTKSGKLSKKVRK